MLTQKFNLNYSGLFKTKKNTYRINYVKNPMFVALYVKFQVRWQPCNY